MPKGIYVEEAASFEIRDGVVAYISKCGDRRYTPLCKFRITLARANRAVAEYDAKCADIIQIRPQRDHAASS